MFKSKNRDRASVHGLPKSGGGGSGGPTPPTPQTPLSPAIVNGPSPFPLINPRPQQQASQSPSESSPSSNINIVLPASNSVATPTGVLPQRFSSSNSLSPISILSNSASNLHHSIVTNASNLMHTIPIIGVLAHSGAHDRPRKKLSFRDPEIIGQNLKDNMADSQLPTLSTHLEVFRNQGLSASMENMDLETQAMRIVRTVGQAFEVCHKMNVPTSADDAATDVKDAGTESGSEEQGSDAASVADRSKKDFSDMSETEKIYDSSSAVAAPSPQNSPPEPPPPQPVENYPRPAKLDLFTSPESKRTSADVCVPASTPLALQHEVQLLREQLEQQQQQTHAALAQVHLLRDQLAAETAARMEAQARTHQLLVHNKELLDHIQTLVLQMQELESKLGPSPDSQMSASQLPNPASTSAKLPVLSEMDFPSSDLHLIENPRARDSTACEPLALGLQQQLQQQQQQYALMLAQMSQQMNFLPPLALYNNYGALAAAASPYNLPYSALSPPPHTPRLNPLNPFPTLGNHAPAMSTPSPGVLNNNTANSANLANFYSSAQASPPSQSVSTNFILPLAEPDQSTGNIYPLNLPPIANRSDPIRQLQDAVNPTASANSLSSDSDRQRFDSKNSSSLESMSPASSHRTGLPSLHQQLEQMRLGATGSSAIDGEDRDRLSTMRRNGPFITRSTSEKVPHRNEILAQVQRTAWARHTTK